MAEPAAAGPPGPRAGPAALPALALVLNAFVWGIAWWPFRELQAAGLHPLWATAGVYLFSLAVLLAARPQALRQCAGQPGLWLLAFAAGLTNVGFNWAVTVGDVVRVVLLFYLMPAWSVLLAWPLLGERLTPVKLLRLALALAGVAVVLGAGREGLPLPRSLPDLLALMGGLCFALTNILLRRLAGTPAPARVFAMFGGAAVMALAVASLGLAQGLTQAPALTLGALPLALLLALAVLGGNAALQYGAARLPAHATALIMLSEVVFAGVSAVALGAGELTGATLGGGAMILAAAAWAAWPAPAQPTAPAASSPA